MVSEKKSITHPVALGHACPRNLNVILQKLNSPFVTALPRIMAAVHQYLACSPQLPFYPTPLEEPSGKFGNFLELRNHPLLTCLLDRALGNSKTLPALSVRLDRSLRSTYFSGKLGFLVIVQESTAEIVSTKSGPICSLALRAPTKLLLSSKRSQKHDPSPMLRYTLCKHYTLTIPRTQQIKATMRRLTHPRIAST